MLSTNKGVWSRSISTGRVVVLLSRLYTNLLGCLLRQARNSVPGAVDGVAQGQSAPACAQCSSVEVRYFAGGIRGVVDGAGWCMRNLWQSGDATAQRQSVSVAYRSLPPDRGCPRSVVPSLQRRIGVFSRRYRGAEKSTGISHALTRAQQQQQQRQYVPGITARFQSARIWQEHPTEWHREHDILYVYADLVALKGQRQPGICEV